MSADVTRRHFEEELAYLRELGEAFSQHNPDIAPLLSSRAADPDVERLMEGFAFLTGRLRQRAEEQLPELAQGLLEMIWPHYLRPLPAMTMLRFDAPRSGIARVPAGAQVLATPIDGVGCRFRTCETLELLPATIGQVTLEERAASATLSVRIDGGTGFGAAMLAGRPLRLFMHGPREAEPGPQLLHALLRHCASLVVTDGATRIPLPPQALRHAGLEQPVLPWPPAVLQGYRVIQEYLNFPARMLFLELPAVPESARLRGESLTFEFGLDRRLDLSVRLQRDHIHLNCVPAINLFMADGEPILPSAARVEHRVRPQGAHAEARVHSVDAAEGAVQGRAQRVPIPAFSTYAHALPGAAGACHVIRLRPAVVGRGADTWISFNDAAAAMAAPLAADVVSLRLTVTDGEMADRIPLGGLNQPGWGCPPGLACRNITPVTPEAVPPLGGDLMWRLIAGLSASMQPLGDLGALRSLLSAHALRAQREEPERRRLERMLGALHGITLRPMMTLVQGVPVHGREVVVEIAESGFGGIAGAFLFGAAFDGFITTRASINTCWRLVLVGIETRAELRWPARAGEAVGP